MDRNEIESLLCETKRVMQECDRDPERSLPMWAVEDLHAALRHLLQAQRWRPISDQDKDGRPLLLFSPDICSNCPPERVGRVCGRWLSGGWVIGRVKNGEYVYAHHQPTHCMDLPDPPSTDEEPKATPSEQQGTNDHDT